MIWENIGEGGSTVVGCVLGAKASVGAMKGASTAAVDDVIKSLDNVDDVTKALKGVNRSNADEVAEALKGIDHADDVINAAKANDLSALGKIKADKSLTGGKKVTETIKAFGQDALSSSKNNARIASTNISAYKFPTEVPVDCLNRRHSCVRLTKKRSHNLSRDNSCSKCLLI